MAEKDYYKILGVDKNATEEEIKKVYRKKALKWHPDRWTNATDEEKKKAEDTFKEINEAYSILTDKEKRANYDQFGTTKPPMGDPFDDFDPFSMYRHRHTQTIIQGENAFVTINLTLEESYFGIEEKTITFNKQVRCHHCNGTGSADGEISKCSHCEGSGVYRSVRQNGFTTVVQETICPYCKGSGKMVTNPCSHCKGSGLESVSKTLTINVLSGTASGMQQIMANEGHESTDKKGPNGNLVLSFNVQESEGKWSRQGIDLYYELDVNLYEALCGGNKEFEMLGGKKINIKVPENSKHKNLLRLSGKGFNNINHLFGPKDKGDLFLVINYVLPKKITAKQKKLLKEFVDQTKE